MPSLSLQRRISSLLSLLLALLLVLGSTRAARADTHVVQPGETLLSISEALGIDPLLLARSNNISDPRSLQAGQSLVIPDPSGFVIGGKGALVHVVDEGGGRGDWVVPCSVSSTTLAALLDYCHCEPPPKTPQALIGLSLFLGSLTGSPSTYSWPTFGQIATYFGEESNSLWKKGYHEGLDIAASYGSIVRAADDGVVIDAGVDWQGGYGSFVKLNHRDGSETLYAHLSRVCARPWQYVKRGQVIGLVGNSGFSTGSHLHFEVRVAGQPVDPLPHLP